MVRPSLLRTLISALIVSSSACSLIGSTMPVVPRIEMPPSIPSFPLKVLAASSSPRGTEIVTSIPGPVRTLSSPRYFTSTSRTASSIILLGVLLIAASPTG